MKGKFPTPKKVGRLDRVGDVRAEMARLYREARRGQLHPKDAVRLMRILQALGALIETSDLEQRLGQLEALMGPVRPGRLNGYHHLRRDS